MNRRRRGSLTFVAPPGPLASAPVASAGNFGMLYLETGHPLNPDGILRKSNGFIWDIQNKDPLASFAELPSSWYDGVYPVTGYKYKVYPTLPALRNEKNAVVDDVQFLGRFVPVLSTANSHSIAIPVVCNDMRTNDWSISFDLFLTQLNSADSSIFYALSVGGNRVMQLTARNNNQVSILLWNAGNVYYKGTARITPNTAGDRYTISKLGNTLSLSTDSESVSIAISDWVPDLVSSEAFISGLSTILPMKVWNVSQSLNGVTIDDIPCKEESGSVCKNILSSSRGAVASTGTTRELGWYSEGAPEIGKWIYTSPFRNNNRLNIACVGDSISAGFIYNGWFGRTISGIDQTNYAVGGSTDIDMFNQLEQAVSQHKHSVVLYSTFTPNVGATDAALVERLKASFDKVAKLCSDNGVYLITTSLCPVNDYLTLSWHRLDNVNYYPVNSSYPQIDLMPSISDMEDPNRFLTGMNHDNLHPNQNGFDAMAALYQTLINDINVQTASWYPLA